MNVLVNDIQEAEVLETVIGLLRMTKSAISS